MKNKIILSTVTTLALLLSGCSDTGTNTASADAAKALAAANLSKSQTIPTEGTNDSSGSDLSDGESQTIPAEGTNNSSGSDLSDGGGSSSGNGDNTGEDIPNPGEPGLDIPGTSKTAGGWYARTVVSATASDGTVYTHSTAGVFGKLIDSQDSLDQHDIPSFGPSSLQVIFPQAEQEEADSNGYFSEYQAFSEDDSSAGSWEFQIKNQVNPDLSNAPISISLKGVYDLTYKKVAGKVSYEEKTKENSAKAQELTLLDVDNATYYSVEDLKTANLTMDGKHTRTFKWVLGTVEESDYTPSASTEDDKATIQAFAVKNANDISSISSKGGKFGLPPQ